MIKLTEFASRHFDPSFKGTKIYMSKDLFEIQINEKFATAIDVNSLTGSQKSETIRTCNNLIFPGYADFCKQYIIKSDLFNIKAGAIPITLENYQYLRSGYSARNADEVPVLGRWFEFPEKRFIQTAKYLNIILYSKEQLEREDSELIFDTDWGIVAILGQLGKKPEPPKPATIIRNSMGISEGGSGHPFNRMEYKQKKNSK